MSGTNRASGGRVGLRLVGETSRRRMVYFVVAVILGAVGIAWIDTSIWRSMGELERGFAAIQTERFYRGVHMRMELRRLNELLLGYQLDGGEEQLSRYVERSARLGRWIAGLQEEPEPVTRQERELYLELQAAFDAYVRETAAMQDRPGLFGPSRRQVDQLHEQLARVSEALERLSGELIEVERGEFQRFLAGARSTLDGFQTLIQLSVVSLILLSGLVVMLVYRGMIQPLRKRLWESEATIHRQEKLASLGTLAAGVAHEIRNPLTAIKFRLFSLGKVLSAAGREDLGVIDREIERLDRIVKDFIQFARPSEPERVRVPAGRVLEEVARLMTPQLRAASVELKVAPPREEIWIEVDPQQLQQVMINLIQNAVDSMPDGGCVTVGVDSGMRTLVGARRPAAVISVADTGKGMTPEVAAQLFDPFFTTKEGGTGLGLSIAARIVEKLGGELQFETEPSRGTTFFVLLERVEEHEA